MSLGTITVLERCAAVGPVTKTRCVFLGDSSYPAGGTYGFEALFQAAVGRSETIMDVKSAGNSGNYALKYQKGLAAKSCVCDPTANTFTTSTPHGLKAGDAVEFAGTALPAGISASTRYFVIATGLTATVFQVSATVGGASIDETTAGTAVTVERKAALFVQLVSTGAEQTAADLSGVNHEVIVDSY